MKHTAALTQASYLIADDKPFIRGLIQSLLRQAGVKSIYHASSGQAALETFSSLRGCIDVLICDWNMEPVDGLELAQTIRAGRVHGVARGLPIILLTGHPESAIVKRAARLDINRIFVKPVKPKSLLAGIDEILSKTTNLKDSEAYIDLPPYRSQTDVYADRHENGGWLAHKVCSGQRATIHRAVNDLRAEAARLSDAPGQNEVDTMPTRRRALEFIDPGTVLAETIKDDAGDIILSAGTRLTREMLRNLSSIAGQSPRRVYLLTGETL